jgi:hypothetical protein
LRWDGGDDAGATGHHVVQHVVGALRLSVELQLADTAPIPRLCNPQASSLRKHKHTS